MFTYKFYVSGTGKLCVRLRNNDRKSEYNLLDIIKPEELNLILNSPNVKKGVSPKNRTKIANYTLILDSIREELLDSGNRDMDVFRIRDLFADRLGRGERGVTGDFVYWFEKFIATKANRGTKSVYQQTLDKIRRLYENSDYLKFSQVNVAWLEDFERKCAETSSKNSRNIHLRNIRAVFNYALSHDLDIPYPFRRFKIRPEVTRKRSLPVEELREIFNFQVEPYAEIYRDMFKLIFMLIGINATDLYGLKGIENGYVNYRRAKTGRLYSIKVEPEAKELIEKYRGKKNLLMLADRWNDHRNFLHQCNKALRLIGADRKGLGGKKQDGKWPELTTYWARHTWATIARRLGISKDDIALALGHSTGHDVTDIYIEEDMERVDRANRKVLDWVLYGKTGASVSTDTPVLE